jgi:carboxymethylenebutenolidase
MEAREIVCPGGMPAYVAYPERGGRFPVIVLMHERYGLVAHTRDLAQRCAGDGFLVIAPNFFFRHPDQAALNAGGSRYDMTDVEAIDLIKTALNACRDHPAADMDKIAVAGYCQTGRHPLVYAAEVPITAAVVCAPSVVRFRHGGSVACTSSWTRAIG